MQTDVSATIATSPDQTLFQNTSLTPYAGQAVRVFNPYGDEAIPAIQAAAADTGTPSKTIIQCTFSKSHRDMARCDFTSYEPSDVACTLNTFDTGETRANEIVCMTDTQPNTTIGAGGGVLGALTNRMYKDPPVCCFQTSEKCQAHSAPQTARRELQGSHGERGKSSQRSTPDPIICIGSDTGKASVDIDLCGTLHVVGGVPCAALKSPAPCRQGTTRAWEANTSKRAR